MSLKQIHGVPLDGIKVSEHIERIARFRSRPLTSNLKKEIQSEVSFLSSANVTQEKGKKWRAKNGNVNVVVLKCAFDALYPITNIPVHRVCKVAYNLNVFISQHYDDLKPFLDSFQCLTEINKVNVAAFDVETIEEAFAEANKAAQDVQDGKKIIDICALLAQTIKKIDENDNICSVVFMRDEFNEPMFFPVCQKTSKFRCIDDKTIVKRHQDHVLSSIVKDHDNDSKAEPSVAQKVLEFSSNLFEITKDESEFSDQLDCIVQTLGEFSFDFFGDDCF